MKVCTDATLFGAMAPISGGEKVLDIGTGTGLLSLMAAQLGAGEVTAVELMEEACEEAAINFRNSPWADQLKAVHQDIRDFTNECEERFDLIISNPPFFDNHSRSSETQRSTARHNDQLPFDELLQVVEKLLEPGGKFYLLIPVHAANAIAQSAKEYGLYLKHRTDIRGYGHNQPKITAMIFDRNPGGTEESLLTIYSSPNIYSPDSEKYLSDFLLRFA